MTQLFMTAVISMMGMNALAAGFPEHETERADRITHARGECARNKADNGHMWICSADNIYVKGFMGESSNKQHAMSEALAKCDVSSALPCFTAECHQN